MKIKIGNCGWSYYNPPEGWEESGTKLQAYARAFGLVEINSTFYGIPKIETAAKWRQQADEVRKSFEFTVKVSQIITHKDRFSGKASVAAFSLMKKIGHELRAKVLLFQSPDSFMPSEDNLKRACGFFGRIDPEDFILAWEVRWKDDWKREIVGRIFSKYGISQCVDPLRQDCYHSEGVTYYRLHGFGSPMYNYQFSEQELRQLAEKISSQRKPVYVLFNNSTCYSDALRLEEIFRRP